MSKATEMGMYAKGVLDASASRGILSLAAKATLLDGVVKVYEESFDVAPFEHEQVQMGGEIVLGEKVSG